MSHLAATLEDLLADYEATANRWKHFFDAHPDAALVPTDIAGSKNIGDLVFNIHAASFRTAQLLLGEELTNPASRFPVRDVSIAFTLKAEVIKKLKLFLETASEATLEEKFEIRPSGSQGLVISGTKRKLCLHVIVHAIRHWAQIATIVRSAGFPPDRGQDILFSEAIR